MWCSIIYKYYFPQESITTHSCTSPLQTLASNSTIDGQHGVNQEYLDTLLEKASDIGSKLQIQLSRNLFIKIKDFNCLFVDNSSSIPLISYGNKSGSLWEGNYLLQLWFIIMSWFIFVILTQMASRRWNILCQGNPRLSMLLNVLDAMELHLPDAQILTKFIEKEASELVAVYCGLASIWRKPMPRSTQTEDFER